MSPVDNAVSLTELIHRARNGDADASDRLFAAMYDELRRLAAHKMAQESPGQTLQATALVHEAYVRLVGADQSQGWDSRGHFFAAAAEAMRRILVEAARRKRRIKHGGRRRRVELSDYPAAAPPDELLALDEALDRLAARDPARAELVKLRYFAGLTVPEAAAVQGVSVATAERSWAFARAWLNAELNPEENLADG